MNTSDRARPFSRDRILILLFTTLCLAFCIAVPNMMPHPSGIHFIRQTDSIAFVVHFREFTSNLFEPGVLDLRNAPDQGAAAAEFPIIYWLLGGLERLVGPMPTALCWLNVVAVLVAQCLFALALAGLFRSSSVALGVASIVTGSSILAHYSFNFLPDAGVYALAMIGWCLAMPSIHTDRPQFQWGPVMLFTLAGAIKAPAAMHLIAWSTVLIIQWTRTKEDRKPTHVLAIMVAAGLVASWHLYARAYNAEHSTNYFLTWSEPIWEMTTAERLGTWQFVTEYWWTKYLHPSAWHVFGLLALVMIIRWRRLVIAERITLLLLLLAGTAFVMLFFRKFADHDYYFLTLLPTLAWVAATGCRLLLEWIGSGFLRGSVSVGIGLLGLSSLILARTEVDRRTTMVPKDHSRIAPYLIEIREHAAKLHLSPEARVVVVGDSSANGALIALGRLGWAFPGYPPSPEPLPDDLVHMGATHLLVVGRATRSHEDFEHLSSGNDWELLKVSR